MHRLRSNRRIEELAEAALLGLRGLGYGGLHSSLALEAHLLAEVGAHGLAGAEAETGGHGDCRLGWYDGRGCCSVEWSGVSYAGGRAGRGR